MGNGELYEISNLKADLGDHKLATHILLQSDKIENLQKAMGEFSTFKEEYKIKEAEQSLMLKNLSEDITKLSSIITRTNERFDIMNSSNQILNEKYKVLEGDSDRKEGFWDGLKQNAGGIIFGTIALSMILKFIGL